MSPNCPVSDAAAQLNSAHHDAEAARGQLHALIQASLIDPLAALKPQVTSTVYPLLLAVLADAHRIADDPAVRTAWRSVARRHGIRLDGDDRAQPLIVSFRTSPSEPDARKLAGLALRRRVARSSRCPLEIWSGTAAPAALDAVLTTLDGSIEMADERSPRRHLDAAPRRRKSDVTSTSTDGPPRRRAKGQVGRSGGSADVHADNTEHSVGAPAQNDGADAGSSAEGAI